MPDALVYDDACGFCTWATELALRHTDLDPVGFSELSDRQRERLPAAFERCAHLLTDDAVYSCGACAERVLERMLPGGSYVFGAWRTLPGYAWVRERCYRQLADRRSFLGQYLHASPPATREA